MTLQRTFPARSLWPDLPHAVNLGAVCTYQEDMCASNSITLRYDIPRTSLMVWDGLQNWRAIILTIPACWTDGAIGRDKKKTISSALVWGWKASWIVYHIGHAKDSSCKITVACSHHNWLRYTETINQRLTRQTSRRIFNLLYLNSPEKRPSTAKLILKVSTFTAVTVPRNFSRYSGVCVGKSLSAFPSLNRNVKI